MIFEFNQLQLPAVEDKLKGPQYDKFKRSLVALMMTQRAATFNAEASNDGPWEPLGFHQGVNRQKKLKRIDEARLAELRRKGYGGIKILQDTGLLRQSFTDEPGPGNSYRTEEIDADEVALITTVPYARIHNEGGIIEHPGTSNGFNRGILIPAHTIDMPERAFDQFTDENKTEINELTELFLNGEYG